VPIGAVTSALILLYLVELASDRDSGAPRWRSRRSGVGDDDGIVATLVAGRHDVVKIAIERHLEIQCRGTLRS